LGFLLKEGLIDLDFINRLHTPSFIISWWEYNEPIFLDLRKKQNDPTRQADFEYLYKAVKKQYPNIIRNPIYNLDTAEVETVDD
jgi:hypothetical protein